MRSVVPVAATTRLDATAIIPRSYVDSKVAAAHVHIGVRRNRLIADVAAHRVATIPFFRHAVDTDRQCLYASAKASSRLLWVAALEIELPGRCTCPNGGDIPMERQVPLVNCPVTSRLSGPQFSLTPLAAVRNFQ